MSKNEKNVPKRRFKEFENADAWEQRKLSELTSLITKGTTPLDKSGNGNINFIKIENIDPSSNKIISTAKITMEEHDGYLKRSQLQENDILFSIAGTLGRVTTVNREVLPANTNQALAIIRLKSGYLRYITTYLKGKAVSEYIKKNPTIGAQPNLSLEQVGNLEISFPKNEEQIQIGDLFQHLDNLITLHQCKLEKIKALKKAYLTEMFPSEGERKPKLRFAGFTDEWEQRKLNEIADILDGDRGNNYPNGNEFQEGGHTLFLSASNVTTNGFMFGGNQYITEEKSDSMGNGKLVLDDIVLTSRGSIGHIAWYNKAIQQQVPFARINSGMLILRAKDFVMPCFVAQFLKSPLGKKQIDLISFGSAQPQLTKKDVSNYVVSIPSDITEQRKLGVFFDNIDNLITLHQRKFEKLQNIKKAYLNEMFI